MDERINELRLKIRNKEINDFTADDNILIQENPDLMKEYLHVIAESKELWDGLFGGFPDIDTLNILYGNLSVDEFNDFLVEYFEYGISKGEFRSFITDDDIYWIHFDLKDETEQKIREIIRLHNERIMNASSIEVNLSKLKQLIASKRFDIISKCTCTLDVILGLGDEEVTELLENFPFEKYDTPLFFAYFAEKLLPYFEKLSLVTLTECITSYDNSWIDMAKAKNIYLNKIITTKYDMPTFNGKIMNAFFAFNTIYPEIAKIAVNNNIMDFASSYYYYFPAEKEMCVSKLEQIIENIKVQDWGFLWEIIKQEDRLIDAMINNGYLGYILSKDDFDKIDDKTNLIIDNLNNNPKYADVTELSVSLLSTNINFIKEILRIGKIKVLKVLGSKYDDDIVINLQKEFPDVFIRPILVSANLACDMIITLLNVKNYDGISYYLSHVLDLDFLLDYKEAVLDALKNGSNFARKLLNANFSFILSVPEFLEFYTNDEKIKEMFFADFENYLIHNTKRTINQLKQNPEAYRVAKEYFINSAKVNINNYNKLEARYGIGVISYLFNENMVDALNLDENVFDRLLSLFSTSEYTLSDLESSYDAIKQYKFSNLNPDIVNVFSHIMHNLDGDYLLYTDEVWKRLDDNFFKKIKDLPDGYAKENAKTFLEFVISRIKNCDDFEREKYVSMLHSITDYYIIKCREEYREKYSIFTDLDLDYEYDEKSLKDNFLKSLLKKSYAVIVNYGDGKEESLDNLLVMNLINYGLSEELAKALVNYANNSESITNPNNEILTNYRYLIKAMQNIAASSNDKIFSTEYMKSHLDAGTQDKLRKKYYLCSTENDPLELMGQLNIGNLTKNVLDNDEVYGSLKSIMSKMKLDKIPSKLSDFINNSNYDFTKSTSGLAAFISYYNTVYERKKKAMMASGEDAAKIHFSLPEVFINGEALIAISSIYLQILGDEDANLIKTNPGPNSATRKTQNNERLKEAVELTKTLFNKREVTIPTFNEVLNLDGGKSLRVIVGNFNHPSNLTHGERTGACMRIGGAGESLFDFAIYDKNGFHIRFEDPVTGEYISRVTGFRNGNTVFLNELRNSCNAEKYSDLDVVNACKVASSKLIEMSEKSASRIDNVVVHNAYAMTESKDSFISLGVSNIKEGLSNFYSDVSSVVKILATTTKDGKFAPVNFDKSKVPSYMPAREIPKVFNGANALGMISRVYSVKRLLAGDNLEDIELIYLDIKYAIVSKDWYVYVDNDGVIHKDLIDIDPRAKDELFEAVMEVEKNLGSIMETDKEDVYGLPRKKSN